MKTIEILKNHYDDEKLVFNETTGRYELTLDYVKTLVDAMPYKDSKAKFRIKDCSRRIYTWIFKNSCTYNREVINFMLDRTENGRKYLLELMESMMLADLEYAYLDFGRVPTINIATGQEGDRDNFAKNQLPIETEDIANDSINYFGFNLLVQIPFAPFYYNLVRQYEGE